MSTKKTKKVEAALTPNEQAILADVGANVIDWVAVNSASLEAKFAKKYPRSRNRFNVAVRNINGSKRAIVVTADGTVKLDKKNSYANVLTWASLRKLGCPLAQA